MAERTRGMYRFLSLPGAYSWFQNVVGAWRAHRRFLEDHVHPLSGQRVLDVGCGTGEVLELLPEVHYVGFDPNDRYIASAQARFGARGCFQVGDVGTMGRQFQGETFDLVLVIGVLHHLDDAAVTMLFQSARDLLAPGGRLLTLDAALATGQGRLARWIIRHDRGQHVRTDAELLRLAVPWFPAAQAAVHHDYLRIPYTHVVLDCPRPATAPK